MPAEELIEKLGAMTSEQLRQVRNELLARAELAAALCKQKAKQEQAAERLRELTRPESGEVA